MADICILFEDSGLMVINKPSGMVVNRADSVKGQTVQDWADLKINRKITEEKQPDDTALNEFLSRSGIVHRIDKETSGLLLVAKTPEVFVSIKQQFMDRSIRKTYLMLVHGRLEPAEGVVNAPIGRLPWNRERFGILPDGREAVTIYKKIREISGDGEVTLAEAEPKTGRTHQIRVHMAYIRHPVVGDYMYAGRKQSREDRLAVRRVMLHAWKIEFIHPDTGQRLHFEAPVPEDMRIIIGNQTF